MCMCARRARRHKSARVHIIYRDWKCGTRVHTTSTIWPMRLCTARRILHSINALRRRCSSASSTRQRTWPRDFRRRDRCILFAVKLALCAEHSIALTAYAMCWVEAAYRVAVDGWTVPSHPATPQGKVSLPKSKMSHTHTHTEICYDIIRYYYGFRKCIASRVFQLRKGRNRAKCVVFICWHDRYYCGLGCFWSMMKSFIGYMCNTLSTVKYYSVTVGCA